MGIDNTQWIFMIDKMICVINTIVKIAEQYRSNRSNVIN